MTKIRLLAALISLVLTPLTVWLIVKLYFSVKGWVATLTPEQLAWFNYSQIGVGVLIMAIGLWQWHRKKKQD